MRIALAASILPLLAVGCGRSSPSVGDAGAVHTNAATVAVEADAGFTSAATELAAPVVDAGGARGLAAPAGGGQKIDIPAGTFASGSTPGDEGRVASIEPALADVTLGAFAIDALPYPNDPARAPEMASSQSEAARLCSERGARLCTELEWERACKGPEGDRFATGPTWNAACDSAPSRCASGFGVRAMGFMREWTDSKASLGAHDGPVIRGTSRRCAARSSSSDKGMPGQMAFRCCHGDRNEVAVPPAEGKTPFRRTDMSVSELTRIFAGLPELKRISENIRYFENSDVKQVVNRGSSRDSKTGEEMNRAEGISFATAPILWSPEPGIELLVTSGRAKKTGFVVALWTLPPVGDPSFEDHEARHEARPQNKYRFASSFLFLDDPAPVVLAWEPSHRKELRWTTCWGCAGEQGAVSLRDDGRVVIVQY